MGLATELVDGLFHGTIGFKHHHAMLLCYLS
jgi:hypothetical protein